MQKADSFRVITHQLILRFVYLYLVKSQAKVSADEKYKKSGSFKMYIDLSLVFIGRGRNIKMTLFFSLKRAATPIMCYKQCAMSNID